jgi:hypothetical protein
VKLTDAEYKKLRSIIASTRRTLGQELAYRAFQAIDKMNGGKDASKRKGRHDR